MKNFLDRRNEMVKEHGPQANDRRTGKSTANCFAILSEAILNRNKPVKLYDHHSNNRRLLEFITVPKLQEIIRSMDLEGFTFNKSEMTITYRID